MHFLVGLGHHDGRVACLEPLWEHRRKNSLRSSEIKLRVENLAIAYLRYYPLKGNAALRCFLNRF